MVCTEGFDLEAPRRTRPVYRRPAGLLRFLFGRKPVGARLLLAAMLCSCFSAGVRADGAVTVADPEIPKDELELRLKPLTRAQLKVEADAWLQLLQAKVKEISTAEIAAKYKKKELAGADDVKDALAATEKAEQAAAAAPGDEKAAEELEQAKRDLRETLDEAKETLKKSQQDKEVQQVTRETLSEAAESGGGKTAVAPAVSGTPAVGDTAAMKESVKQIEEQQAAARTTLLNKLTELREQRTALVDRTNAVIAAYEEKGGPEEQVQEYRQYVAAVSGIKVDVSDAEAVWTTVIGWLGSSEGGLRWARNLILFVVTVLIFVLISNMAGRALEKLVTRTRQTSRLLGDFMVVTVRRLILAIGIIVGLAAMEVNIGPLLAVIGAAGFVIAFALQNSLGNFASGILILVFRPFDIGDVIEVAGVLGKVQSMNLLSINILTPDNKSVIVANNQVWGGVITNVTGSNTRRVDLVFGIAYGDDIEHARRVLEEVVSAHDKVLKDPETVIRVHELGDSSVNFICRPWVRTADYWEVYWDLTAAVKQRFDREGISIPFPQRDVHLFPQAAEPVS
jgi:small conductance mechanosensitive channel